MGTQIQKNNATRRKHIEIGLKMIEVESLTESSWEYCQHQFLIIQMLERLDFSSLPTLLKSFV
jgi:hypothetical protein